MVKTPEAGMDLSGLSHLSNLARFRPSCARSTEIFLDRISARAVTEKYRCHRGIPHEARHRFADGAAFRQSHGDAFFPLEGQLVSVRESGPFRS